MTTQYQKDVLGGHNNKLTTNFLLPKPKKLVTIARKNNRVFMNKEYNVVAIGNAIVDVVGKVSKNFLAENGLAKGSMSLVDASQSQSLYLQLENPIQTSGGSAANTVAGMSVLGCRTAFIGRVKNDSLGEVFANDLQEIGVDFISKPCDQSGEESTAKCIIAVTDDAQRTMATYLGVSPNLTEDYADEEVISKAQILYLEGYLWDSEQTKNTIKKSIEIAKNNGVKVAFTLSDPFCVDRHRFEFLELITNDIDILFANESEIKSLFETQNLDNAIDQISKLVAIAAITKGAEGSVLAANGEQIAIEAVKNIEVVDTTGAGDLYAAGFLSQLCEGSSLKECGENGSQMAANIIEIYGARLEI